MNRAVESFYIATRFCLLELLISERDALKSTGTFSPWGSIFFNCTLTVVEFPIFLLNLTFCHFESNVYHHNDTSHLNSFIRYYLAIPPRCQVFHTPEIESLHLPQFLDFVLLLLLLFHLLRLTCMLTHFLLTMSYLISDLLSEIIFLPEVDFFRKPFDKVLLFVKSGFVRMKMSLSHPSF